MKRLGRFFFDLVGVGIAAVGLIISLISFLGGGVRNIRDLSGGIRDQIDGLTNPDERRAFLDAIKQGDTAHWLSLVGIIMGALAVLIFVVAVLLIFKSKSHMSVTVSIYVFAIVAIGLAVAAVALAYGGDFSDTARAIKDQFNP